MNDPAPPSRLPISLLIAGLSILALATSFFFRPAPVETDSALLRSGPGLSVVNDDLGVEFTPSVISGDGLIFYPGARVEPESYAWLGVGLAERGHPVFVARFPLDFALFAPARALAIRKAHPELGRWAIGGHGLGGEVAASFAHDHPGSATALVLLASMPPYPADLSSSNLRALLVTASEDGIATESEVDRRFRLLPPTTRRVVIEGGNHAQFGEYGEEQGDGHSKIEGNRQRAMTVDAILSFLEGEGG